MASSDETIKDLLEKSRNIRVDEIDMEETVKKMVEHFIEITKGDGKAINGISGEKLILILSNFSNNMMKIALEHLKDQSENELMAHIGCISIMSYFMKAMGLGAKIVTAQAIGIPLDEIEK